MPKTQIRRYRLSVTDLHSGTSIVLQNLAIGLGCAINQHFINSHHILHSLLRWLAIYRRVFVNALCLFFFLRAPFADFLKTHLPHKMATATVL